LRDLDRSACCAARVSGDEFGGVAWLVAPCPARPLALAGLCRVWRALLGRACYGGGRLVRTVLAGA